MHKPMYDLYEWSVVGGGDPYTPPECDARHMQGISTRVDGTRRRITTSPIVGAERKFGVWQVETLNSIYVLEGPPDPAWLQWLDDIGYKFDPDEPIKVRG